MADDKLQSFKIARDQQRPTTRQGKGGKEAAAESKSLGFARIENILENTEKQSVLGGLNDILSRLAEFETSASANKDKAAVKKAIAAVERTVDLMEYLFQTKEQLQAPQP